MSAHAQCAMVTRISRAPRDRQGICDTCSQPLTTIATCGPRWWMRTEQWRQCPSCFHRPNVFLHWFVRLIAGAPLVVRLPIPTDIGVSDVMVLQTDPINEIGEVWAQSRDAMLVFGGFAAGSALLISLVVGSALRPLTVLSAAFEHVGRGQYHGLLPATGPPELMRVVHGFNCMTQQLATADAQNHRLNERLLTLQSEERADLARDLHDEVGPLLFAVDMTAAAIERLPRGREAEIVAYIQSIHEAVARMQRHLRVILGRLRPNDWWRSGTADSPISASTSLLPSRRIGLPVGHARLSIAWSRRA